MKNIIDIQFIIATMSNNDFDAITTASNDTITGNKIAGRNAMKRLKYHLKKHGLTVTDWNTWQNL